MQLEEARKKLEDYERVSKVHRTLTNENTELEKELSSLNTRLEQADVARKNELAEMKVRYEGQMNTMRDELKSLHNQVKYSLRFSCMGGNINKILGYQIRSFEGVPYGFDSHQPCRLVVMKE